MVLATDFVHLPNRPRAPACVRPCVGPSIRASVRAAARMSVHAAWLMRFRSLRNDGAS